MLSEQIPRNDEDETVFFTNTCCEATSHLYKIGERRHTRPPTEVFARRPSFKDEFECGSHMRFYGGSVPLSYTPSCGQSFGSVASVSPILKDYLFRFGVHVENIFLQYPCIHCTIRVLDIATHKKVFVRFTSNGWKSFNDVDCMYVANTADGVSAQFYATLRLQDSSNETDRKISFAVCYEVGGSTYWDNNEGQNYDVTLSKPGKRTRASKGATLQS